MLARAGERLPAGRSGQIRTRADRVGGSDEAI
jgi:hypothetical protein